MTENKVEHCGGTQVRQLSRPEPNAACNSSTQYPKHRLYCIALLGILRGTIDIG
jgi:hypothetical protein